MNGPIELVATPPVRPLVKRPADIGAKQTELNEIQLVSCWSRVLIICEPGTDRYGRGRKVPRSL